jgi:hypothetical protein
MSSHMIVYTERLYNQEQTFMRSLRFYSAFTCVFASACILSLRVFEILLYEPSFRSPFFCQCFLYLNSFACIGIGLGLPLALIAAILGWGQFTLLIKGNIHPHLGREGFVNTLGILLSKL